MRVDWTPDNRIQSGVDHGVLYLAGEAVPWNGLSQITQNADDTSISRLYFDGVPFGMTQSPDDFSARVEAWTFPVEFEPYLGLVESRETNQPRIPFDLSWRVDVGESHLIHLVWSAFAVDQELPYSSTNNELEVSMLTWDIFATPKVVTGIRPTAHFVVDTDLAPEEAVEELEDLLYGTSSTDGAMPDPQDVIDLFLAHAVLIITDNGDGTWTASGPDDVVTITGTNTFRIKWPSALYITPDKFKVSTL